MEYEITRFEEQDNQVFMQIVSKNNPVYVEHHFSEEEAGDIKGTTTNLIAELMLLDEQYTPPAPRISRLDEVSTLKISDKEITTQKNLLIDTPTTKSL